MLAPASACRHLPVQVAPTWPRAVTAELGLGNHLTVAQALVQLRPGRLLTVGMASQLGDSEGLLSLPSSLHLQIMLVECVCAPVCLYVDVCMCAWVCVCTWVCVCALLTYLYTRVCMYVCSCVDMYAHIRVCVCVCFFLVQGTLHDVPCGHASIHRP